MEQRGNLMKHLLSVLAMSTLALSNAGKAQSDAAPAFEVASIKSNNAGGNYIEVTPQTLTAHSATLATCIAWAYRVPVSQVSGSNAAASSLLDSERYEIVAKAAGSVTESQLRLMLQTLLADRFKVTLHRQSRVMQTWALLIEKREPKLHASEGDGQSSQQVKSKLTRQWTSTRMSQFADNLSEAMQAPVEDQTGLPGKYDFSLDLTPYLPTTGERPDIASMMTTAVREELGLKLESRRAPTDVLVIDHVEKPSPN
jgi:uncharacterized protein (TIGR03435 family)